jgi:prolipoprotein diacylglyceryltransferase/protein-S-isoprenylcysteine O-methyltransferase Ste14
LVKPIAALPRLLYGALFVIVVPAGLALWAGAAAPAVSLRRVQSVPAGVSLAAAGLILMALGARELIVQGRGLPMNAFPPARLVQSGVFRWIRNPMYIGFGLACAGLSIATGSTSGLWVVTPAASLAAAALVYGFERQDLARRFGSDALRPPLLSLPRGGDTPPTHSMRAAVGAWVLLPWLLTYYAVQALGPAPDAFHTTLAFERRWPVWQWTEALYASCYLFVPLTALFIPTQRALRRFALSGGIATVVVGLLWLTVPVVAEHRPFAPTTLFGRLLAAEQHVSAGVAAFPAFHVLWALIAAVGWTAIGRHRRQRTWAVIGWSWAGLIALSCLTTGMHGVIDLLAAGVLFLPLSDPPATWRRVRAATEWIANSWREWRVGPLRLINHGLYAAAAAAVGFGVIATATGPEHYRAVLWMSLCSLLGAGIWGQLFEGSSKLLRPFGWYGGVTGALVGALTAPLLGAPVIPLLAAMAVAAPWIQMLGRVRCLVQGCCHGGLAAEGVGIRYRHPRSRVVQLSHLAGRPIHATPLYSIAGNLVVAAILLRLRTLGAADTLVLGVFLILNGLARFVEEGYRAEPQTPVIGGLHSYQWLAIASVLGGAWCTTLRGRSGGAGFGSVEPRVILGALAFGLLAGFAMGVDFPQSNRRFSRLASAD